MMFATLEELEARLDWDLSDEEKRVAESALEDLTTDAREYGRNWTEDDVPASVRRKVLAAAARYMKNLEGVVQSRAGDETLIWSEDMALGSPAFTPEEIKGIIATAIGPQSLGTIPIQAFGPPRISSLAARGYVPTDPPGDPFPLFSPNDPINHMEGSE